MKRFLPVASVAIGLAAAIGLGTGGTAQAAPWVHFDTPQAAMRYLADAYNRGDNVALHHVTTPESFKEVQAMHSEAVSLKLEYCTATGHGDYHCYFQHRYPKSFHNNGYGASFMVVAPALNPGWYMYGFFGEGCG